MLSALDARDYTQDRTDKSQAEYAIISEVGADADRITLQEKLWLIVNLMSVWLTARFQEVCNRILSLQ
jgi:hypothetical protein